MIQETTVLKITCDNPACPGTDLDTSDRTGWLFISSEVYGEPTKQSIFCSTGCMNAITMDEKNILNTSDEELAAAVDTDVSSD